jgi:hypothetical protein
VTFLYALLLKDFLTFTYKLTRQTLPSEIWMNSQVVNIAAPAIVTAKDRSNDIISGFCDKAHTWITLKIGMDCLS